VTGHVALVVEDDPVIARMFIQLVLALGHTHVHASTLAEARALVEKGGFCYALVDMQLPAMAGGEPLAAAGETILRLLREKHGELTAAGKHVLQIVVVSGYSTHHEYMWHLRNLEVDGFVAKPFGEDMASVAKAIRDALARAEREDHAKCAPWLARVEAPAPGAARLVIDGERAGARNVVCVNGKRCELQDQYFTFVVRLVDVQLRAPGRRSTRGELGIALKAELPSRARRELKKACGVDVIEIERGGVYRLWPAVVVERVDWAALERHAEPAVAKIAKEWAGGRGA
jgi:CheY-like chemotaxis protein